MPKGPLGACYCINLNFDEPICLLPSAMREDTFITFITVKDHDMRIRILVH